MTVVSAGPDHHDGRRVAPPAWRTSGVIGALNAEWAQLAATDHPELAAWRQAPGPLRAAGNLDDVLAFISITPDPTLTTLLRAAQIGDQLAARTIVQAFIPRLCRLISRVSAARYDEAAANGIGQLWELVMCYPLDRRPQRIAANLALDLLKSMSRNRDDGVWESDQLRRPLLSFDAFDQEPGLRGPRGHHRATPCVDDEVVELLETAVAARVITIEQAGMLRRYYTTRTRKADLAREYGIAETALRHRVRTARRALEANAADLYATMAA